MKRNSTLLAGAAVLGLTLAVAATVALTALSGANLPLRAPYSTYVPSVPQGCVAVAPGAYTAICPDYSRSSPVKPALVPNNGGVECTPVAPGAFTHICVSKATGTATPRQTVQPVRECRPVAPGAFTEICIRP